MSDTRPGDPFAALSPLENSIAERVRNEQLRMTGDENEQYCRFRSENGAKNQWARGKRVRFHMLDALAQVHTSVTLLFALIVVILSLTCPHCRRPVFFFVVPDRRGLEARFEDVQYLSRKVRASGCRVSVLRVVSFYFCHSCIS